MFATEIFLIGCGDPGSREMMMSKSCTCYATCYRDVAGWRIDKCLYRGLQKNATPLSMPSPSNQWKSWPRSRLLAGLPPLRTYSPVTTGKLLRQMAGEDTSCQWRRLVDGSEITLQIWMGFRLQRQCMPCSSRVFEMNNQHGDDGGHAHGCSCTD